MGIRFLWSTDPNTKPNEIDTWGYFTPDKEDMVSIVLLFHENEQFCVIDKEMVFELSMTIQHELRHVYQHFRRGHVFYEQKAKLPSPKNLNYQEIEQYLLIPDEIDAYAVNILLELSYEYPNLNEEHLKSSESLEKSITWKIYEHFPHIRTTMLKKIYKLYGQGHRYIS